MGRSALKIYTSYFYQIRNFTPNIIPVSTALSDPTWYRPPQNKEYYIDKRGVVCGLRYEPLIVQKQGTQECFGTDIICPFVKEMKQGIICPCMQEYEHLLNTLVDKEKTLKAFIYCCNKFNADTIALIVYETPTNPCSERRALQKYFDCKEWEHPVK